MQLAGTLSSKPHTWAVAAPPDFELTTAPRAPSAEAASAVAALWRDTEPAEPALERLTLDGSDPVLPSSFAVGCAAQATPAAAGLAATEIGALRNGVEQRVAIDMRHAALECCGHFTLDGRAPVLQRREGGSWHVEVSLARTACWLRDLGRVDGGFGAPPPVFDALMQCWPSGYGELRAVRHAAVFSNTPACWALPSMPPGSHPLAWSSG